MLVHTKSKKLLLNVNNPERITTVIPTAKTFTYRGRTLLAVPHRDDETKVLRNLGYEAPSPVLYYYTWPSILPSVYEHQKDTVRFLTDNKRAFCLNDMGCVDSETEYLSPTGWRKISEYTEGKVAQYNLDTQQISFIAPTEYIKRPCDTMYRIKTKYGVDQMLSGEHRMVIVSRTSAVKKEVVSANTMFERQELWVNGQKKRKSRTEIGWTEAAIPVTFIAPEKAGLLLTDDELRVQVAVIADGHFPSGTSRCIVRVKKERKKLRMRHLLDAASISYKEYFKSDDYSVFVFYAPMRTKEFDTPFWSASEVQLRIIATESLYWDGHMRDNKPTSEFSSTSKKSADFVQYAFAATGRTARVLTTTSITKGRSFTLYTVIVRNNGKPLQLTGLSSTGDKYRAMSEVPSTDGFKYCFSVPDTYLVLRRNGCIFITGNTGKTLSTAWALDYLQTTGLVKKALVVSPLSTLERAWGDEIWRNFPHLTFAVLHGSREKRLKLLEQDVDLYIINHDGVKVKGFKEALAARPDIDIIIIDEVASFRNSSTDRWKALNVICNKQSPRRVWGLTGTPTPNEPTDAWAQCKLIVPERVPSYFGKFKDMTMRQITQYKWVARDTALDVVFEAMQPAIRYKRSDCIDLPPTVFETRHAEMTDVQKKAYKLMLSKLAFEAENHQVLAVNEAVKASKLVQIACGSAYADEGITVHLDCTPRIEAVKEVIEEAAAKVLVFVPFTAALQHVASELSKHWETAIVHGDTKKAERDEIFTRFQRDDRLRVIVANPGTLSHGLSLTAGNTIIWFAPTNSNETFEQACARVVRPGQKLSQLIVMIEGSEIERKMYARLQGKQKMQGLLLDMLEG